MISAIVFSRNRACQLDALLSSLAVNAPGVFDVTVLWRDDTEAWRDGYLKLMPMHPTVTWVHEVDFREQLLNGMPEVCRPLIPEMGPVCFFTDDDIMYRQLRWPGTLGIWAAFSLRLGLNTTVCFPHNREQALPVWSKALSNVISWYWAEHPNDPGGDGDFGYPMSLDGHVLHAEDVRSLLGDSDFSDPNEMEAILAGRARMFLGQDKRRRMACFTESHLVGVPANRVTTSNLTNRVMDAPAYSPEALNEMFLDGWRIAWRDIDYSGVNAAHVELSYVFDKALP